MEESLILDDQIEFIELFKDDLKNETKRFLLKNPDLSFDELIQNLNSFLLRRKNLPDVVKMISDFREYFDYIFLNLKISDYEKEILLDFIDELNYELR